MALFRRDRARAKREPLGYDEFGNPTGKAYDLGGFDDERVRGERILLYIAYRPSLFQRLVGERFVTQDVVNAVAERNFQMDVMTRPRSCWRCSLRRNFQVDVPPPRTCVRCSLRESDLAKYSQLWYLSDQTAWLSHAEVQMIKTFNEAGNGLLIWGDNQPFYADANLLARAIVGVSFNGNKRGDGVLKPGPRLERGVFIEHPLTSGLNNLYEGITISSIVSRVPVCGVTILAQSHDGQNCMACFERGSQRVVMDTGFTKICPGRFHRTAGTGRYFRNIAFWLARGSRDSQYKLLTGPEQLATIKPGQTSGAFGYDLKATATLMYILAWTGDGELALQIHRPSGAAYPVQQSSQSPLRLDIPNAEAGLWRCQVCGVRVPGPELPYVLTVIERKPSSVTPQLAHYSPAQPQVSGDLWPCYVLVDCSQAASDVAPQIGSGISALLRGLRAVSFSDLAPAVSFIECRAPTPTVGPLCRLTELKPISLACRGEPTIGPALGELASLLEAASAPTRRKPLVLIVLTADPCDYFEAAADHLRRLVTQGRMNVIAVGLGHHVAENTLRRLATIPLQVEEPHGAGTVQCFEWLAQSAAAIMASLARAGQGKAFDLPPLPTEVRRLG